MLNLYLCVCVLGAFMAYYLFIGLFWLLVEKELWVVLLLPFFLIALIVYGVLCVCLHTGLGIAYQLKYLRAAYVRRSWDPFVPSREPKRHDDHTTVGPYEYRAQYERADCGQQYIAKTWVRETIEGGAWARYRREGNDLKDFFRLEF